MSMGKILVQYIDFQDIKKFVPERTCRITSEEYDDLLDIFTTNFSCGHYGIGLAKWFKHCPECRAKVVE